ncbi:chondroitin sulfate synthase 1 isoform X1 [Syngnathoides biaculeatus]|uniref:chondroitin sulfate synthase 1 isoform X1 n=1 Tax=Syngnathoides biaculeatus TaxID=300417 RepID=UPI002ADE07A2|nr:chondroitin sulfate synthase 1 isoform X1 [Syngnathoides biaculeatus]
MAGRSRRAWFSVLVGLVLGFTLASRLILPKAAVLTKANAGGCGGGSAGGALRPPRDGGPPATEATAAAASSGDFLFVGVMTAQKYLNSRAVAAHRTWAQSIPGRVEFFSSEGSDTSAPVPVVALSGVDDSYPPQKKSFMMLKYMHDHYLDKYEWFMRADDDVYVKGERLESFLRGLNSSAPVFLGQTGMGARDELGKLALEPGENFCMGGPGVIMSREVLRRVVPHVRQCLREMYTTHEDVEVGRCVRRFAGVQCVWSYEMQQLFYENYEPDKKGFIRELRNSKIHRAITLHPNKNPAYQYRLHGYLLSRRMAALRHRTVRLHRETLQMAGLGAPEPGREERRLGAPPSFMRFRPGRRRDVLEWDFLGAKHLFSAWDGQPPRRATDAAQRRALDDVVMQGQTRWRPVRGQRVGAKSSCGGPDAKSAGDGDDQRQRQDPRPRHRLQGDPVRLPAGQPAARRRVRAGPAPALQKAQRQDADGAGAQTRLPAADLQPDPVPRGAAHGRRRPGGAPQPGLGLGLAVLPFAPEDAGPVQAGGAGGGPRGSRRGPGPEGQRPGAAVGPLRYLRALHGQLRARVPDPQAERQAPGSAVQRRQHHGAGQAGGADARVPHQVPAGRAGDQGRRRRLLAGAGPGGGLGALLQRFAALLLRRGPGLHRRLPAALPGQRGAGSLRLLPGGLQPVRPGGGVRRQGAPRRRQPLRLDRQDGPVEELWLRRGLRPQGGPAPGRGLRHLHSGLGAGGRGPVRQAGALGRRAVPQRRPGDRARAPRRDLRPQPGAQAVQDVLGLEGVVTGLRPAAGPALVGQEPGRRRTRQLLAQDRLMPDLDLIEVFAFSRFFFFLFFFFFKAGSRCHRRWLGCRVPRRRAPRLQTFWI